MGKKGRRESTASATVRSSSLLIFAPCSQSVSVSRPSSRFIVLLPFPPDPNVSVLESKRDCHVVRACVRASEGGEIQ